MNSDVIPSGPGAFLSFNIASTFSNSCPVTHPSKDLFFTHGNATSAVASNLEAQEDHGNGLLGHLH